jgi:ribosomal protein S27E
MEAPMSDAGTEDDYFARLELEKKRKLREELRAREEEDAVEARKALHDNKCGKCGDEMTTVPFRGVEIEICPGCGAVLLDPGELEQLAGTDNGGAISSFFETFFGKK